MARDEPPQDAQVTWHHDGVTALLPGASLPAADWVRTLLWLTGGIDVLVLVISVILGLTRGWTASQGSITLTLMVLMPLLVLPFLALGAVRARGTAVTVGVRSHGSVTYTWMNHDNPVQLAVRDLVAVSVPAGGPPTVALTVRRVNRPPHTHQWRLRTPEHALWFVGQVEAAMAQQAEGQGQPDEVPEAMARLQQASRDQVPE